MSAVSSSTAGSLEDAASSSGWPSFFAGSAFGLSIFVLVLLQGLAGYFRPSPTPKPKSQKDESDVADPSASSGDSLSLNETFAVDGDDGTEIQQKDYDDDFKQRSKEETKSSSTAKTNKVLPKPRIRQYWEYLHRSVGMTLLGLAWYNCTSGIELHATKYEQDDEQQLMTLFWSITGTIAGSVFFIGYVIRPESGVE